jgi:hypothetical protein
MMPRLGPPYPGDDGTAGQAVIKREGLMWVLVVLAINAHTAFFYPRLLKRTDVFCQGEGNHSDVASREGRKLSLPLRQAGITP